MRGIAKVCGTLATVTALTTTSALFVFADVTTDTDCRRYVRKEPRFQAACDNIGLKHGTSEAIKRCKSNQIAKPGVCDPNGTVEALAALTYGGNDCHANPATCIQAADPASPAQRAALRCQAAIGKAAARYYGRLVLKIAKCISKNVRGRVGLTVDDCLTDAGIRSRAQQQLAKRIERACSGVNVADIGSALQAPDAGGSCASCVPASGSVDVPCLRTCIEDEVDLLIDDIPGMSMIFVGDLSGTVSVVNSLGEQFSEIAGGIVLDATGKVLELNALITPVDTGTECTAGTCEASGSPCTTNSDCPLGSTGLITLTLDDEAQQMGGLTGNALDVGFTALVNSNEVDDALGTTGDVPVCIGGMNAGDPCTTGAECDSGVCRADTAFSRFAQGDAQLSGSMINPRWALGQPSRNISGRLEISFEIGFGPGGGSISLGVELVLTATYKGEFKCPAKKHVKKKETCVQPVVIADNAGSNPTVCPDLGAAQTIWSDCCINLTVKAAKQINEGALKNLNDRGRGKVVPSAEAKRMNARSNDNDKTTGCVEVYCVDNISRLACGGNFCDEEGSTDPPCSAVNPCQVVETGKDVSGGGFCIHGRSTKAYVIIVEGADGNVLAHELGHALGLTHADDHGTIMQASGKHNVPNPSKTRLGPCKKAYRNGNTRFERMAGGELKDCCMKPDLE